jgi:hypothetical protein
MGFYFGESGCLECPLCDSCEREGLCDVCDCQNGDNTTSGDAEEAEDSSTLAANKKKERKETAVAQSATSAGSSIVLAGSSMTGSPDVFVSLFMTVELFSYLPLINMELSSHQVDLLVGANQVKDLPNYLPGLKCSPPQHSRKNYDFECSNFLKITQKELTILCVLSVVTLVSSIAACARPDCLKRSTEVLEKVLPLARKLLLMIMVDSLIKAAYSAQLSGIDSVEEGFSWLMIVVVWGLYALLGGVGCLAACSKSSSWPLFKHFLFNDLKPITLAKLNFSFLVLHRTAFALLIISLDASRVQLLCLSVITAAVSPSQFTLYLLTVRPYQDIKDSILQLGTHCIITGFLSFLTLFEFGSLGDDKNLASTGFMWSIMSVTAIHILAMLAKVVSIVKEICESQNEELSLSSIL